jgi:Predicted extracellular nuclease
MVYYTPVKKIADITERERTIENILRLRQQLDKEIPKRSDETLLLATWNIREFKDNRRKESLYYIAEIMSRFDLIAVQEVSPDLKGLEKVIALMDPSWTYIVTDSTEGDAGGGERMAFVFDSNKVTFGKMAGEIVLPETELVLSSVQFARTPYCVSFRAKWFRFKLATVHIYYGNAKSDPEKKRRPEEIRKIAKFLTKRADKENESYILLGDFNIEGVKDVTMQALEEGGFYVPDKIKKHPTDLGQTKHYDQIAFNLNSRNICRCSRKMNRNLAHSTSQRAFTVLKTTTCTPNTSRKNNRRRTRKEDNRISRRISAHTRCRIIFPCGWN